MGEDLQGTGMTPTCPAVGQTVMVGTVSTTFVILGDMVEGRYSAVEQLIRPGQLVWPHVHTEHDQVALVLEGEIGVRVGDTEWTAFAGELAYRPRGLPHAVWNTAGTTAKILELTSPGSFEDYFFALSQLIGAEQVDERSKLAADYGVSPVAGWAEDLAERYSVRL
jgi:quercetin dioxygenase-like cupin family protein